MVSQRKSKTSTASRGSARNKKVATPKTRKARQPTRKLVKTPKKAIAKTPRAARTRRTELSKVKDDNITALIEAVQSEKTATQKLTPAKTLGLASSASILMSLQQMSNESLVHFINGITHQPASASSHKDLVSEAAYAFTQKVDAACSALVDDDTLLDDVRASALLLDMKLPYIKL
eukprot:5265-Heterococcus_DN1.PRE.12